MTMCKNSALVQGNLQQQNELGYGDKRMVRTADANADLLKGEDDEDFDAQCATT